jgi:thiol:disulfide interchange protein
VLSALLLLLGPAPATAQDEVVVTAKPQKAAVVPGDQFAIAVVFHHKEGWHIHTNAPKPPPGMDAKSLIATAITPGKSDGLKISPVQWPSPLLEHVDVNGDGQREDYAVFAGRAIAYVPVSVSADVPEGTTLRIPLVVQYQACDAGSCLGPETLELTVDVPVISLAAAAADPRQPADADFQNFDPASFAKGAVIDFSVFGLRFSLDPRGFGFVLLLLVAALGGFLLNLTPCVLPVLPLKIMGISAAAGNPARCLYLGTVMSLGVIAFWVAIGAAIAFVAGFTAISSLFQTPWFSIGVGLFILVMAVGMLGAYAVQLPKAVYMINPNHETAPGSFVFGVMTAVLSTPCTAPFMGSAAAWAATQNAVFTLATFGAIGAGMALPYLILSAFPRLLSSVPRTGPASELIKQVMGLLLAAVAVFFLGTGVDPLLRHPVDPPIRFYWWIVGLTGIGAMVWLFVRTLRITRRPALRAFWGAFAVIFAAVSMWVAVHFTDRGPIPWIGYTPERLVQALATERVVVMDFTAEWCLNCKALEAGVLHRKDIVPLLKHPDVVPMKVDLTGNNLAGKQKLKELGWVGIPLLAVYGPEVTDPIKYDAYTPEMVKEAVRRAGGPDNPDQAPRTGVAWSPPR